ncbi:MAG: hypothetical protein AB4038_16125 [Prochloraceae cyanobacterium]
MTSKIYRNFLVTAALKLFFVVGLTPFTLANEELAQLEPRYTYNSDAIILIIIDRGEMIPVRGEEVASMPKHIWLPIEVTDEGNMEKIIARANQILKNGYYCPAMTSLSSNPDHTGGIEGGQNWAFYSKSCLVNLHHKNVDLVELLLSDPKIKGSAQKIKNFTEFLINEGIYGQ